MSTQKKMTKKVTDAMGDYLYTNLSMKEICERRGCTSQAIYATLKRLKIPKREIVNIDYREINLQNIINHGN